MSEREVWVKDGGPRLLAGVPCEDLTVSAAMRDGRVSVQRVFYDLYAGEFPAAFSELNVVTIWSGGKADREYRVGVRLSGPDGTVLAEAAALLRGMAAPNTTVHTVHFASDGGMALVLPAPGRYSVDVLLEEAVVHTFPLHVIQLQAAEAPQTQTVTETETEEEVS